MRGCIVDNIKNKITNKIRGKLLEASPSFRIIGEEVFIPVNYQRNEQEALELAKALINNINETFKANTFGPSVFLNTNYSSGVGVRIIPSQRLLDAYEVKEGTKGVEDMSNNYEKYVPYNTSESLEAESRVEQKEETSVEEDQVQFLPDEISNEQLDEILERQGDSLDFNKNCI